MIRARALRFSSKLFRHGARPSCAHSLQVERVMLHRCRHRTGLCVRLCMGTRPVIRLMLLSTSVLYVPYKHRTAANCTHWSDA